MSASVDFYRKLELRGSHRSALLRLSDSGHRNHGYYRKHLSLLASLSPMQSAGKRVDNGGDGP
jgi:hypothetical protein